MNHEQEMLRKDIEAEMVNLSAEMAMQELVDGESEDYRRGFINGYCFRSEMVEETDRIYFDERR